MRDANGAQFALGAEGGVIFASSDCQGQPYVEPGTNGSFYAGATLVNGVVYLRNGPPPQNVVVGSTLDDSGCRVVTGTTATWSPAAAMQLQVSQFTPPFSIDGE